MFGDGILTNGDEYNHILDDGSVPSSTSNYGLTVPQYDFETFLAELMLHVFRHLHNRLSSEGTASFLVGVEHQKVELLQDIYNISTFE